MHIMMTNPHSGQTKVVKLGFSWTLFFFTPFYGIPLFVRGLHGHGAAVLAVGVLAIISISDLQTIALVPLLDLVLTGLAFFYGIKGNELTFQNLLAKGWQRSDGGAVPYAAQPVRASAPIAAAPATLLEGEAPTNDAVDGDEKVCPRCAESVKAAASVCRHCGHNVAATAPLPMPSSGNWSPLKIVGVVALVFLGLMVIGAFVSTAEKAQSNANHADTAAATTSETQTPALSVTAYELFAAYEANEQAAQLKYGGQPIDISGNVASVELDAADQPMVSLEAGDMLQEVTLHFRESDAGMTAQLRKGQWFVARCTRVTELIGAPQLNNCSVVQDGDKEQGSASGQGPAVLTPASFQPGSPSLPTITSAWLVGTWGPAEANPNNDPTASCETDGVVAFKSNGTFVDGGAQGRFATNGATIRYFARRSVRDIADDPTAPFTPKPLPEFTEAVVPVDKNTFSEGGTHWRRCQSA